MGWFVKQVLCLWNTKTGNCHISICCIHGCSLVGKKTGRRDPPPTSGGRMAQSLGDFDAGRYHLQSGGHSCSWICLYPIGSMYGIFTYIYHKNQPNVGKYTSPMDPVGTMIVYGFYHGKSPLKHQLGSLHVPSILSKSEVFLRTLYPWKGKRYVIMSTCHWRVDREKTRVQSWTIYIYIPLKEMRNINPKWWVLEKATKARKIAICGKQVNFQVQTCGHARFEHINFSGTILLNHQGFCTLYVFFIASIMQSFLKTPKIYWDVPPS